jgi:DNA-binding transcriptional LysR family regulator
LLRSEPRITMKVVVSDNDEVLPALRSGQLDLVIQYLYPLAAPTGLIYIPLYEDETVPCCARTHRLAACNHVTLDELSKERWAFQGPAVLGPQQRLHEVFRDNGLEPPRIALESRSFSLRLQVAANSDLLMYISRAVVARRLGAGTFHVLPVKELHWRRSVGVVHRKEPYMSPAVRRFIEILTRITASASAEAPGGTAGKS